MAVQTQLIDHSKEVFEALEAALDEAYDEIGSEAVRYAQSLCPVDTGRLRASLDYKKEENTLMVGSDVDYAKYVETGTMRQKAQPFLKPAMEDKAAKFESVLGEKMKEKIK